MQNAHMQNLHILPAPFNGRSSSLAIPESGGLDPLVCSGTGASGRRELNSTLLLAEGHLNRQRFGAMLGRIALLPTG